MKDQKRAIRRNDIQRLKNNRKNYTNAAWWRDSVVDNARGLGKVIHTTALCSCPMCGNPRKYYGERTIQEKRFMQDVE